MIHEEETQKRFGYLSTNLTAKSKKKIVACCDECGKKREVSKYAYRSLCLSCSAKLSWAKQGRRDNRSKKYSGKGNPFFDKQHSVLSKNKISEAKQGQNMSLTPGDAAKNKVINRYKRGARNRSLEFDLSEQEAVLLLQGKCHYCGSDPGNVLRHGKGNGVFVYNGIDRKDNSLGYLSNNCVSCCDICNKAKRNLDYELFVDWLKRVARHHS